MPLAGPSAKLSSDVLKGPGPSGPGSVIDLHFANRPLARQRFGPFAQRGWGQFEILEFAPEAGAARVRLRHSAMVDEARRRSGRRLCHMFSAWLEGSLEYVGASAGRPQHFTAREVHCAAEGVHDHCLFEVSPQT
jgi:predicted hydrocarbon binding protein